MAAAKDPRTHGYSRIEASRELSVDRRTIHRWITEGKLETDEQDRITYESVERVLAEECGDEQASTESALRAVLRQTKELTQVFVNANTKLLEFYQEELKLTRQDRNIEIEKSREHTVHLQDAHLQVFDKLKDVVERHEERAIALAEVKASTEIKQTALGLLKTNLPTLMSQIGGTAQNQTVQKFLDRIANLDDERLKLIAMIPGIVTSEDLDLIELIRGRPLPKGMRPEPEPEAPSEEAAESSASTNGAPAHG